MYFKKECNHNITVIDKTNIFNIQFIIIHDIFLVFSYYYYPIINTTTGETLYNTWKV